MFFGYTQCPDVCPTTLSDTGRGDEEAGNRRRSRAGALRHGGPGARHAGAAGEYVPAFDPRFVGLSGDAAATERVAKEFKVIYQKQPGATPATYTVDHSTGTYMFDPQGRLRLYVSQGQSPDVFAHDLSERCAVPLRAKGALAFGFLNLESEMSTPTEQMLAAAASREAAGEGTKARALYDAVLAMDPENPIALWRVAEHELVQGSAEAAAHLLERARPAAEQHRLPAREYWFALGRARMSCADPHAAQIAFARMLEAGAWQADRLAQPRFCGARGRRSGTGRASAARGGRATSGLGGSVGQPCCCVVGVATPRRSDGVRAKSGGTRAGIGRCVPGFCRDRDPERKRRRRRSRLPVRARPGSPAIRAWRPRSPTR